MTLLAALAAAAAVSFLFPPGSGRRLRALTRGRGPTPRRPSARPNAGSLPAALVLDLVAAVLDGGASPATAARRVAEALAAAGDPAGAELERCADAVAAMAPTRPGAGPSGRSADPAGHRRDRSPGRSRPPADRLADSLAQALLLAAGTGLAPAPLVRRAAAQHRRRAALAATAAARRLAVLLILPTGLCLLPAFVLLGVVPVAIGLFSGLAPALG